MTGIARVILLYALHHWVRTLILSCAVSVAVALPLIGRVVVDRFERGLHARASTVPMVVGAAGSRFDLVFTALHFRQSATGTLPLGEFDALLAQPGVEAIPMHARSTARGEPLVAVGFEYFSRRGLVATEGRLPAGLAEAVLGFDAARRLGLGIGDELPSDQRTTLDITAPPSIVLKIVGVLQRTGSPDDRAVFVDLETAWLLEGIAHGHDDPQTMTDEHDVYGRAGNVVALTEGVRTYQRVTEENIASFHVHERRDRLPLTAILVFPPDERTETILAARYNASPSKQAARPSRVIDELIAFVIRLRTVFDAIAGVLVVSTVALVGLISMLSVRIRSDELTTLGEIGVSRPTVAWIAMGELLVIGLVSAVLVTLLVAASGVVASLWIYG